METERDFGVVTMKKWNGNKEGGYTVEVSHGFSIQNGAARDAATETIINKCTSHIECAVKKMVVDVPTPTPVMDAVVATVTNDAVCPICGGELWPANNGGFRNCKKGKWDKVLKKNTGCLGNVKI